MGHLKKKCITGEAKDVETIARLRPWIEDECKRLYGQFTKTNLFTDYDANRNVFKFKLVFCK